MKNHHEYGKDKRKPGFEDGKRNIRDNEWLTEKTLYNWRKKTAIEIQFFTRTKKEFYELYLRNLN